MCLSGHQSFSPPSLILTCSRCTLPCRSWLLGPPALASSPPAAPASSPLSPQQLALVEGWLRQLSEQYWGGTAATAAAAGDAVSPVSPHNIEVGGV